MATLSKEIIEQLYLYGKKVHNKELDLTSATKRVVDAYQNLISDSSAEFYIGLYSHYLTGKGSTWNQNSELVLYYVEQITLEQGLEAGKKAYDAGMYFAKTKGKKNLINNLNELWEDLNSGKNTGELRFEKAFEQWLRNSSPKKYIENTIRRYIRALNKADEWFQIKLKDQILNIGESSTLISVEKEIRSVPGFELINQNHGHGDFSAALRLYKQFLEYLHSKEENDSHVWWPSLEEYHPGFNKEQWLHLLNDPDIIGPVWGNVLAMFYTEKDGITCTDLADKFNDNFHSIRNKCMNLARSIHEKTNCPVVKSEKGDNYWPILFVGRKPKTGENGTWVWKLRDELYDALTEFDILRYLNQGKEEPEVVVKDAIGQISSYIASKGFSYDPGLIENFYLSLKSKPFVILAGTSGTGKTRLVRLFAEAIGAEYKMVPVRPDWSDSSDLFGHVDLNGRFVPGAVLEFISEANSNPDRPYILCLDEMNLARVEYYMSDFLSVIETRDIKDGSYTSDPLMSVEKYGTDQEALTKYGEIGFPQNLYLVGTVNMDETTFPFSKKVLDRANTIEFNHVDLKATQWDQSEAVALSLPNSFLETRYLFLKQCDHEKEYVADICDILQRLNGILAKNNAHVGYRVRDEIVFYMLNNKETGLLSEDEAMDNEIMQKILPRIQGSSVNIKEMLCELFKVFAGDFGGTQTESNNTAALMLKKLEEDGARYRKSAEKTAFMVRRFEEDGFTSYWL